MDNTLEKKSGILYLKSKFFLYRIVMYFSFLLIPVYVQKSLTLKPIYLFISMILYCSFIMSQWFFLGKEIDHRLKIYFRVNSSIDRVVYRLFLGMFFFILIFNLLYLLPSKWVYNSFWIIWGSLGLFYSWPTRGKIIQESVTTNFSEFRYLDSFEKTLVFLIVSLILFSVPEMPSLAQRDALIFFLDPAHQINEIFWNFLTVTFYPFKSYPSLFKIGWATYFYTVNISMYLLTFYAFLRFFISRRLSLLGVFALISSWSFSKIIGNNLGTTLIDTYSLAWLWGLLWVTKSSTYRTGLFIGLLGFFGTIVNQSYALMSIIQIALLLMFFLRDKTSWFKKQTYKYVSFGLGLTLVTFTINFDLSNIFNPGGTIIFDNLVSLIDRKAFFILSVFGVLILFLRSFVPRIKSIQVLKFGSVKMEELSIGLAVILLFGTFVNISAVSKFSLIWIITLFSLIPLELIFLHISRLRSSRNMIYLIYILICLLDSHFEGRVKIFLKLFNS